MNMNLLCTEKQKTNSSTVVLFAFLLNVFITHTQFIYVVLERIFFLLHTILMLTDSSFVIKNTNSIVTILIANLLTLGIIRTVDIFTCPLNHRLGGAKHEIGAMMLK